MTLSCVQAILSLARPGPNSAWEYLQGTRSRSGASGSLGQNPEPGKGLRGQAGKVENYTIAGTL